jgi:hypothetical protein
MSKKVKLRAAYNESKEIISIHSWTDAVNGRGTVKEKATFQMVNYTCVGCGAPVMSKLGVENAHHFAHKVSNDGCGAGETLLHQLAKDIIKKLGQLNMPAFRYRKKTIFEKHTVKFTDITIEPLKEETGSNYRPDLIATLNDGRKVWVEVTVTSETKGDKLQYIIDNDILCIEVNLKDVDRLILDEELVEKIKNPSYCKYINNPYVKAKCEEHDASLSKEELKKWREEKEKADKAKREKALHWVKKMKKQEESQEPEIIHIPWYVKLEDELPKDVAELTNQQLTDLIFSNYQSRSATNLNRRVKILNQYKGFNLPNNILQTMVEKKLIHRLEAVTAQEQYERSNK